MKNLKSIITATLFLICPHLSAFESTTVEEAKKNGPILMSESSEFCVLSAEGEFDCPMADKFTNKGRPELHNPRQYAVGSLLACALDDSGVQCWGHFDETFKVTPLSNPRQVVAGLGNIWILDDTGVVHWQDHYNFDDIDSKPAPLLSHPSKLFAGAFHVCAEDEGNYKCWGKNSDGQSNVPPLSHPTQISLGSFHTCALDDTGVKCWGNNNYGQTNVPPLFHPRQISAGGDHSCALDDNGVRCWGDNTHGELNLPRVSQPIKVSAGGSHICVLDEDGIKCSGLDSLLIRKYQAPTFKLEFLETSLTKTSERLYSSKAQFVAGLASLTGHFVVNLSTNEPKNYRNSLARLMIFEFIEPVVESTQSEYVQEKLLPNYQKAVVTNYKAMGIESLKEIELNAPVLNVLLDSTALALASARNTTTNTSIKQKIEQMSYQVGMLKVEFKAQYKSMQAEKLAEILRLNLSLNSLLMQEVESQPFALVLAKIQNYLENQK